MAQLSNSAFESAPIDVRAASDLETHLPDVRAVVAELGEDYLAQALDISSAAVRTYRARGHFPAAWAVVISQLAADRQFAVPLGLFAFKALAPDHKGAAQDGQKIIAFRLPE